MISKRPHKRILIINPYGIGDVLFTTPTIHVIKNAQPDSFIGYWCNKRVEGVLKSNPDIDKIFPLSRGDIKKIYRLSLLNGISSSFKLLSAIKKERFDLVLDYSLDFRYELAAWLCGIKRRIGHDYKKRGKFLTEKVKLSSYREKHMVEYCSELLKFVIEKPQISGLKLFPTEGAKVNADRILANYGMARHDRIIGIAPGAGTSWGNDGAIRHWPVSNFALLADSVAAFSDVKIVILGDKRDGLIAGKMREAMHSPVTDLTGQTSLEDLVAIVNRLELLITNDGGILHIAVAMNKKTVSFFGPVDPKMYGPYPPNGALHSVLRKNLPCSPCYSDFHLSQCLRGQECLKDINPDEAFRAVSALLKKGGRNESNS